MEARQQDLCQEVCRVKADMSGHRAEQVFMSEAVQQQTQAAAESRLLLTSLMYRGLNTGSLAAALPSEQPAPSVKPATLAARRRQATKATFQKRLMEQQCTRGGADDPEAAVMEPAEELWEPWTDWDGHHHSLTCTYIVQIRA